MKTSHAINSTQQKIIIWTISILTVLFALVMLYPIIYKIGRASCRERV